MASPIEDLYDALVGKAGAAAVKDMKSDDTTDRLVNLVVGSRAFLSGEGRVDLESKVLGKEYFMFKSATKTSRPVNAGLYDDTFTRDEIEKVLKCDVAELTPDYITRVIYSCAISYCCSADLLKASDQKTPGTYFEMLIGHLVSRMQSEIPR